MPHSHAPSNSYRQLFWANKKLYVCPTNKSFNYCIICYIINKMNEQETNLIKNIKNFLGSASLIYKTGDYTYDF